MNRLDYVQIPNVKIPMDDLPMNPETTPNPLKPYFSNVGKDGLVINMTEIETNVNTLFTENPAILTSIDTTTMYELEIYDLSEAKTHQSFEELRCYNDALIRMDAYKEELTRIHGELGLEVYKAKYEGMEQLYQMKKSNLFNQ